MNKSLTDIEKLERRQRAKNKIQLIRRQIEEKKANKNRLLALVREYVSQSPEVTVNIINKWIDR